MKFRTKAACRIAAVEYQRFNEIVSDGSYPCAPATTSGNSRVFEEADIAGLFLYGHLMRVFAPHKFSGKIAAQFACGVVRALREKINNEQFIDTLKEHSVADIPLNGFNDEAVLRKPDDPTFFTASSGGIAEFASVSFDLDRLLNVVRQRMEAEAQIFGEED
ncbi:hypothetical protein AN189_14865 [Loktanella sp. 3ANDIMAR09]|uniref:hypothetical protein n=1 Tax=Loktanella sp. 3ANDIMAR09 TaxID=1225657 RepID=UPI0006FAA028|nr:hypothetical protein [Loktanella sp. 3ANDIMAR09]KQI67592.1 hypothetical protein AN189_14865 [Loktanella sp. 3ANDIMAR09]